MYIEHDAPKPGAKLGRNVPSTSDANVSPSGARFRFHSKFGCALYPNRSHFSKNQTPSRGDEVGVAESGVAHLAVRRKQAANTLANRPAVDRNAEHEIDRAADQIAQVARELLLRFDRHERE